MDYKPFMDPQVKPAKPLKAKKLTFSLSARCICGAGLAYGGKHPTAWDCSDILTGVAIPSGQPGAVQHSDRYPFTFWEIKPERDGISTRERRP